MFRKFLLQTVLLVVLFTSVSYGQDVKVDPLFQGTFICTSAIVQDTEYSIPVVVDMNTTVFLFSNVDRMSFPTMIPGGAIKVVKIEEADFMFAVTKKIKAYKFYLEGCKHPAHIGYYGQDSDGDGVFLFRDYNDEGKLVHIKLYKLKD
jgi:hypothetical protein